MNHIYDMLIIGGGPAGYTAALYGARAGLDTLLFEKSAPGGQLALTPKIDNYPGFEEGIDGFLLGQKMFLCARRFGARTEQAEVTGVDLGEEIKTVETAGGVFRGRTLVLATGAGPRELGVPGEQTMAGRGVHYCAACDGVFYRGKTVVVAGGGNTAAADALMFSRIAQKVILVHRRDTLRAAKISREPLLRAPNVEFRWNAAVAEVLHGDRVTGVRLRDLLTGRVWEEACDGVFVSIGRKPATELVRDQLELDGGGYVLADESTGTSLPGVYAAGDVRAKAVRQVVTAVADGAAAVHYAQEYLNG